MTKNNEVLPLVVICGPTASGKTSLAINLAKKINGEIICADSRTIYRGMDIGTAKPTVDEQNAVPHWGINLVNPGEYYSVADFKDYADQKINDIRSRGHVPFLVGGTGLYIDAVIFNYQFGNPANNAMRKKLQQLNLDELYEYCNKNSILLPDNYKNKRYIIRAIENNGKRVQNRMKPQNNCIIVGITTDKTILQKRIKDRCVQMFKNGVINETRNIDEKYGRDSEAMKSNIYPFIRSYLDGKCSIEDITQKIITSDWHLAKKQMTWLRRNKFIQWFSLYDAEKYLSDILAINN